MVPAWVGAAPATVGMAARLNHEVQETLSLPSAQCIACREKKYVIGGPMPAVTPVAMLRSSSPLTNRSSGSGDNFHLIPRRGHAWCARILYRSLRD